MSTTIDQKVVEMRFDNSNIEKNVQTSISTLDKLKSSLKLTSASKGLENLSSAADKVNMSGLRGAVETVTSKFSALEVMGITALANITTSAINAGTRIVKSLTIDPVSTGFKEYELKMDSIQTIMASTGESLETVNKYLNELNEYSDQTIYSFSDMTSNIGKFTNAGVKLEDAVAAIKGISNEAAISGANANEASRAMYNFAQALSAGYVKLADWKSIELANMATIEFKKELIKTAVEVGTLTDAGDGLYSTIAGTGINATKNFNESLQDEWMTTEVLVKTLNRYADSTTDIGGRATKAATEVKTFTQMLDSLKESAQSGWAQTWELIFGDFEEGKNLWTSINDVISKIISSMTEMRNNFIFKNLSSPWERLKKEVTNAGLDIGDFENKLKEVAKAYGHDVDSMIAANGDFESSLKEGWLTKEIALETINSYADSMGKVGMSTEEVNEKLLYFQKVVKDVWMGDYQNGAERIEALTNAGYDYSVVQDLVNRTIDDYTVSIEDLTDAQLINLGYTEEEIAKIKELSKQANTAGTSVNKLLESMSKPSGRNLLIESFSNLKESITTIFDSLKKAFENIFPDDGDTPLYNLIEGFNRLSKSLVISDTSATNFQKIFEGILSLLKLVNNTISKSLTSGLKLLKAVLGLFNLDLVSFMAVLADYITKLTKWLEQNTLYIKTIDNMARVIEVLIRGLKKCVTAFMKLKAIKPIGDALKRLADNFIKVFDAMDMGEGGKFFDKLISGLETILTALENFIVKLDESEFFNAGVDIVVGLIDGISSGITSAINAIKNLADSIIAKFKEILGINSPSKVFMALGAFIIAGLIQGLINGNLDTQKAIESYSNMIVTVFSDVIQNGLPGMLDLVKTVFTKLADAIKSYNLDLGSLVVLGSIVGIALFLKKITEILETLTKPISGLGKILSSVNNAIADLTKSVKFKLYAEAVKEIAIAIGILAAALVIMSNMNQAALWSSVGALVLLSVGLIAIMKVMQKFDSLPDFGKTSSLLLGMSVSMLLLSFALKNISSIPYTSVESSLVYMGYMLAGIVALVAALSKVTNVKSTISIAYIGGMMIKMAAAFLIMTQVLKILGGMDEAALTKGIHTLYGIGVLVGIITIIADLADDSVSKAGTMMIKFAAAIGIIALVMKALGSMAPGDIDKVFNILGTITGVMVGLIILTAIMKDSINDAGNVLLKMAGAVAIIAITMKVFNTMSEDDLKKGLMVVIGIVGVLTAFMVISSLLRGFDGASDAGSLILKMSAGLILIGFAIKLIANIPVDDLEKSAIVLAGIMVIFIGIIAVSYFAGEHAASAGTMLLKMSAAILVLAVAIGLLSLFDPNAIGVAIDAVSLMLVLFGALIGVTYFAKDCTKTLGFLIGAFAALIAAVVLLSALDPDRIENATVCLSLLMGMFAVLMVVSKLAGGSIAAIGVLIVAVVALGGLMYLLSTIEGDGLLDKVLVMGLVIAEIAVVCIALAAFSAIAMPAIAGAIALASIMIILGGVAALLISGLPAIGTQLSEFMTNLQPFIDGAKQLDENVINAIGGLAKAILILTAAEVLNGIANFFGGGASLEKFGTQLAEFGPKLREFYDSISDVDASRIAIASTALQAVAAFASAIPNSGGVVSWFTGDNDLKDFGDKLVDFSAALIGFSQNAESINHTSVSKALDTSIDVLDFVTKLTGVDFSPVWTFKEAVDILSQASRITFDDTVSGNRNKFFEFGTRIIGEIIDGITNTTNKLIQATKTIITKMVDVFDSYYKDFNNAGRSMASEFAKGIEANIYLGAEQARSMANAAVEAAETTLGIRSPSRVAYGIGENFAVGFSNGIQSYVDKVYNKALSLASSAKSALSSAMSKSSSLLSGVDTSLTITPVVDLSNVKAGASQITSMLGGLNPSIGTLSNVSSISSMMNNQNGSNSDVVSAINNLSKSLGGGSSTTYNINGVTYDDGSNLSSAVESIVRAAKMERRR